MKAELEKLIKYAEDATKDGYPFEVTGEDLQLVLNALKLLASQP
jgi:hypothetical protein